MTKVKREISIKLEEHQIVEKAKELSGLHAEAAEIQKELQEFTKERKAEIKERTDKISQICRIIEAGEQIVTVECDIHKNFERQTVEFWFEGRKVDERGLNEDDRQENIFATENDFENPPIIRDIAEEVFDEAFPPIPQV
jgi:hypothetical protein